MLLLLCGCLLLVRSNASPSFEEPPDIAAWYSAPNYRGTWDLIASCVLTLTVCVWSALHLNVPTSHSKLRERNLKRVKWILLGIFAPELVVSAAFAQYLTARWLKGEIRKDVQYWKERFTESEAPKRNLKEWSITQCYFAVMGSITVQTGDCIAGNPRLSLTAEGVRLLSFLGRLPRVQENQIRDKSKADGLAKTLVILQAGWMVIQSIARVQQKLPVTLLEINTLGHVVCAFALYLLWWSKPLEVKDPILILREDWMDPFISLMWMCSPISGNQEDEISEMRCMAYTPPLQRGRQIAPTVTNEAGIQIERKPTAVIKPHRTHFSVGSIGAKNPRKFIGPLGEFTIASEIRTPSIPMDHNVSYVISGKTLKTAPEHEVFFGLQDKKHGLHHTMQYCRRAFSDCKIHDPLPPCAIERWRLANPLVDTLWDECERRPSYQEFFFTTSTLGIFVGEPIYITERIPNFPGLSYLGSVNVHRDRLKTVVAFAGAAYGGLHLAAWKDYFPTEVERYLWVSCALATGTTGIVLALFFLATHKIRRLEEVEGYLRNSKIMLGVGKWILAPIFIVARIFIVVEAFVCLRKQPAAIYQTPEWSDFIPHL